MMSEFVEKCVNLLNEHGDHPVLGENESEIIAVEYNDDDGEVFILSDDT